MVVLEPCWCGREVWGGDWCVMCYDFQSLSGLWFGAWAHKWLSSDIAFSLCPLTPFPSCSFPILFPWSLTLLAVVHLPALLRQEGWRGLEKGAVPSPVELRCLNRTLAKSSPLENRPLLWRNSGSISRRFLFPFLCHQGGLFGILTLRTLWGFWEKAQKYMVPRPPAEFFILTSPHSASRTSSKSPFMCSYQLMAP